MRWSVSLDRAVRSCERRVFYSQVVSSRSASDPFRREVFALKQLVRLEMWQGNVIHRILETRVVPTLRRHRTEVDVEALVSAALAIGRKQLAFSRAGSYRSSSRNEVGDEFAALYEHEYGMPLSEEDALDQLAVVARTCFSSLAAHPRLLRHLASAARIEAERPVMVRIAEVPVIAKPDVVAVWSGGASTIVDWKVSGSLTASNATQLLVYALAVSRSTAFGSLDGTSIRLVEANLLKNEIRTVPVSERALEETEDLIYRSAPRLRAALTVRANVDALDHLRDLAYASSPGSCALCNFRSVCIESAAPRVDAVAPIQGTLL